MDDNTFNTSFFIDKLSDKDDHEKNLGDDSMGHTDNRSSTVYNGSHKVTNNGYHKVTNNGYPYNPLYHNDLEIKETFMNIKDVDKHLNDESAEFNPFGLFKNEKTNRYTYQTGSNNQYENITTEEGYALLKKLSEVVKKINDKFIKENQTNYKKKLIEAKHIYDTKSNLTKGETWSKDEYNNPAFLLFYCLNKSVQRYTECWSAMISAYKYTLINHMFDTKKINVISLAGGPGYEMLAIRDFFSFVSPKTKLHLTSIDLSENWKEYVPDNIDFISCDLKEKSCIANESLNNANIIVISYAWYMYFKSDHALNNKLRHLVKQKNAVVLILERKIDIDYTGFKSLTVTKLYKGTTKQVILSKSSAKYNKDPLIHQMNYFKTSLK
jgi:hypothetical protein